MHPKAIQAQVPGLSLHLLPNSGWQWAGSRDLAVTPQSSDIHGAASWAQHPGMKVALPWGAVFIHKRLLPKGGTGGTGCSLAPSLTVDTLHLFLILFRTTFGYNFINKEKSHAPRGNSLQKDACELDYAGIFSPTWRRKSKRTYSRRCTLMSSIGSSSLEELIWSKFHNLSNMSPLFLTLILHQLFPHHWFICKVHSYEWEGIWEVNVCLLSCPCFLRLEEMQTQPMAKIDVKAMWSTADWDDQFGHKHATCVTTDLEMQCEMSQGKAVRLLREPQQPREEKRELYLFPLG